MPDYAAFLGHQPHISLAELNVLLPDMRIVREWRRQIVTFETKAGIDEDWLKHVGGTVLIAKALETDGGAPRRGARSLADTIPTLLHQQLKHVKRKAVFSFRCFGVQRSAIRSLYRDCKKHLKAKGLPSRYIGSERESAKPGTLLLRGIPGPNSCELVILRDEENGETWTGKTVTVQDIRAYTERDTGKPFRDTRTGLMPPKLAQIMLNLSLLTIRHPASRTPHPDWNGITVWDPFCGSGVIALEALHLRAHVLASDRTERAIGGCMKNIKWLREREKTPKSVQHHVWKANALRVKQSDLPRKPTVVVTETSLGPALKRPLTKKEIAALIRDAEKLEAGFFGNLAACAPATPVVCAFPVYVDRQGGRHFLPRILDAIGKRGYRITCINNPFVTLTDRHTLLYVRPDQHVGREIVCLLPP